MKRIIRAGTMVALALLVVSWASAQKQEGGKDPGKGYSGDSRQGSGGQAHSSGSGGGGASPSGGSRSGHQGYSSDRGPTDSGRTGHQPGHVDTPPPDRSHDNHGGWDGDDHGGWDHHGGRDHGGRGGRDFDWPLWGAPQFSWYPYGYGYWGGYNPSDWYDQWPTGGTYNDQYYAPSAPSVPRLSDLIGAEIWAGDGTFLGTVSTDPNDHNSIANQDGPYGSFTSSVSILNPRSDYGIGRGALSCWDPQTATPPRLFMHERVIGYLTANTSLQPRVDPNWLIAKVLPNLHWR